ncbi:hypothetical protein ACF0H5_009122 [Mactra antiquata]
MADINSSNDLVAQMNAEFRNAVLPVTIFVGIEVLLAFFGNLAVIYVFSRLYHDCTYRYFVLCLATVDFISSLTTMPGEMVTQLYWYKYPIPEVCKAKSFFNVFTVTGEALCLMAIAADRFLKVCRPLGRQIPLKCAKYTCGVIYLCACICAIPVAIYWGIHSHPQFYATKNTTIIVTVCEKDAKYEKTNHPFQYSVSLDVILSISLAFMLVLYCLIARKFVLSRRHGRTYDATPNRDSNVDNDIEIEVRGGVEKPSPTKDTQKTDTTRANTVRPFGVDGKVVRKTWIMFILTVAFIITTILYLSLLSVIANPNDILQSFKDGEKAVYFFFFRLYFVNHVINPFVYGILDSEFRKHLTDIKHSLFHLMKIST